MRDLVSAPWTPGPWRVEDAGCDSFDIVATTPGCRAWVIASEIIDRPDAMLLAAAPALVEALRDLDPANKARTDCNERKCGQCSICRARALLASLHPERKEEWE